MVVSAIVVKKLRKGRGQESHERKRKERGIKRDQEQIAQVKGEKGTGLSEEL
jgi:hypothetical protein